MLFTRGNETFRTDPTSVHSIVINKQNDTEARPEEIGSIDLGDFGYEDQFIVKPQEKLSYVWTAVTALGEDTNWWFYHIIDALGLDEEIDFETPSDIDHENAELKTYLNSTHKYIPREKWPRQYRYWGIDHHWNLEAFLKAMRNKKLLRELVYGDSSIACASESNIVKLSEAQDIDWDTISRNMFYSWGENNNKQSYVYIKGE